MVDELLIFSVACMLAAMATLAYSVYTPNWLIRVWGGVFSICGVTLVVCHILKLQDLLGEILANGIATGVLLLGYLGFCRYITRGTALSRVIDGDIAKLIANSTVEAFIPLLQKIEKKVESRASEGLVLESINRLSGRVDYLSLVFSSRENLKVIAEEVGNYLKDRLAISDEQIQDLVAKLAGIFQGTIAQREGIDFQNESALEFTLLGFRVVNFEGRDKPDHLLYAGDKLVAIASPKNLSIKESWTLTPERAGKIETEVAREKNLPLVVNIRNKENGRRWICVIEPKDVRTDFTVTAPPWIWKTELTAADEREMELSHHHAADRLRRLLTNGVRSKGNPYK